MALAAVKAKLHDFVDNGNNKKVKALYILLEKSIDELALNASIQRGLNDSKNGRVRPHEEVMTEIRKRYTTKQNVSRSKQRNK